MIFVSAGQVAWWAADRESPFEMYSYSPISAQPGTIAIVDAHVRRDISRGCSVLGNRHLYDKAGTVYDVGANRVMSAKALEVLQHITPDRTAIAFQIPVNAIPGPAKLVTVLNYTCNPLQRLLDWPIESLMVNDVTILP